MLRITCKNHAMKNVDFNFLQQKYKDWKLTHCNHFKHNHLKITTKMHSISRLDKTNITHKDNTGQHKQTPNPCSRYCLKANSTVNMDQGPPYHPPICTVWCDIQSNVRTDDTINGVSLFLWSNVVWHWGSEHPKPPATTTALNLKVNVNTIV